MFINPVARGFRIFPRVMTALEKMAKNSTDVLYRWGVGIDLITITTADTDVSLGDVVVGDLPEGKTIKKAWLGVSTTSVDDSAGITNTIVAATSVQIRKDGGSTWTTGLTLNQRTWATTANLFQGVGGIILGDVELSSVIDGPATYNIQVASLNCDGNNLFAIDVRPFLVLEVE